MADVTRQILIHHTAECYNCEASVDARNALAWAHNHSRTTGHKVELSLGYSVRNEGKINQPKSKTKKIPGVSERALRGIG